MTTAYSFFNKLFAENEKSKYLYKGYNFDITSPERIKMLDKLSIISKYKGFFKSLLLRRNIKDRDKRNYILLYKGALTYPEYIEHNRITEDDENNFLHTFYLIGGINVIAVFYFLIKKPSDQTIGKEMFYSLIFSIFGGYCFRKYSSYEYRIKLDNLYTTLENRLNDNPHLKYTGDNVNLITEDTYEEGMEDNY